MPELPRGCRLGSVCISSQFALAATSRTTAAAAGCILGVPGTTCAPAARAITLLHAPRHHRRVCHVHLQLWRAGGSQQSSGARRQKCQCKIARRKTKDRGTPFHNKARARKTWETLRQLEPSGPKRLRDSADAGGARNRRTSHDVDPCSPIHLILEGTLTASQRSSRCPAPCGISWIRVVAGGWGGGGPLLAARFPLRLPSAKAEWRRQKRRRAGSSRAKRGGGSCNKRGCHGGHYGKSAQCQAHSGDHMAAPAEAAPRPCSLHAARLPREALPPSDTLARPCELPQSGPQPAQLPSLPLQPGSRSLQTLIN